MRGVFNSREYINLRRSNEQFLGDTYDAVLRRYPEITGWNGWLAIINSGESRSSTITGLSNDDGRVTIMMPHPERVHRNVQLSWKPASWTGDDSPWMQLFYNARRAIG
jgi:phosphoribosylformylglycinamidine (FGAM) synthase-like amidotransferase family enzyme